MRFTCASGNLSVSNLRRTRGVEGPSRDGQYCVVHWCTGRAHVWKIGNYTACARRTYRSSDSRSESRGKERKLHAKDQHIFKLLAGTLLYSPFLSYIPSQQADRRKRSVVSKSARSSREQHVINIVVQQGTYNREDNVSFQFTVLHSVRMIDILSKFGFRFCTEPYKSATVLQPDKGGDPSVVKASQKKRGAPEELVDEVLRLYKEWTQMDFQLNGMLRDSNAIQKEITSKRKNKENADDLMQKKKDMDKSVLEFRPKVQEAESKMRAKFGTIGNIVGDKVPISMSEVC